VGRITRVKVCAWEAPEGLRRLLELALHVLEHGLHGAHHEGQPDEGERDEDAERGEGDLEVEGLEERLARASRWAHRWR
jgi:hypothetical protein